MISKKEIAHIAKLARIHVTPQEEKNLEKDLAAILRFIKKLQELPTDDVEPVTGGGETRQNTRADEPIDARLEGNSEALRRAAPNEERGFIKTRGIFT